MSISLAIKAPCRVATSANVTLSGLQTIDSVSLTAGERVLVRAQTDASENGIYLVASGDWQRAADFNRANDCVQGTMVYVHTGTYLGFHWVTTSDPEIGSTSIDWDWQTWTPTDEDRDVSAAGSSDAGAEGISYVSVLGYSAGTAEATAAILPAAVLQAAGAAAGDAVGASIIYAVLSAAGQGAAEAQSLNGDIVYLLADVEGSALHGVGEKYDLGLGTVTTVTDLTGTDYGLAGAGDTTAGRFHGAIGIYTTQAKKYTYATQATSNGTNSMTARADRCACQSSTTGYWFGGFNSGSAHTTSVDKVAWSTETRSAGTALGTARASLAAAGNSTRAIIGAGDTATGAVVTTEKYTYSGDSVAAGTSLSVVRYQHAACGDPTRGIFGGGADAGAAARSTTEKYTYSGDSVAAGTSLTSERTMLMAAGNSIEGLFLGGYDTTGLSSLASVNAYTYASDAVGSGTSLTYARYQGGATCDNPGGL